MSKKKKLAKKSAPATRIETADGAVISDEVHSFSITLDPAGRLFPQGLWHSLLTTSTASSKKPLADAVAAQLRELVPADMDAAPDELPAAPRDLTRYADAFASAQKKCPHSDYEDVVYAKREAYCPDCRQYFKRPRGIFG